MADQLKVTSRSMGITSNNIDNLVIEDISLKHFPAKPLQGYFLAHIYWSIYYKFVPRLVPVKEAFPMVVAQPEISPRSWMNRICADQSLIQHEYGHYLIACWCALEFQQTVNYGYQNLFNGETVQQYKSWCSKIFKSLLSKYCALERKYDQETQHYCNQQKQAEWEKNIVENINQYDRKSKERAKLIKLESLKNQSKESSRKTESRRSFSQNTKPKNKTVMRPTMPASGYRIRPTGLPPRPLKVA